MNKYRAQRRDNKKWIIGEKAEISSIWYILPFQQARLLDENYIIYSDDGKKKASAIWGFVEVFPHTLSQYTTINDNNEVGLWDGDIVRYAESSDYEGHVGLIGWDKDRWGLFNRITDEYSRDLDIPKAVQNLRLRIIGNRWDDTDLVKKYLLE